MNGKKLGTLDMCHLDKYRLLEPDVSTYLNWLKIM